MRRIPEWVGKSDDEPIPARVKVRVFAKYHMQCQACTLPIIGSLRPAYDHIVALINGGENRESNIQLLCVPCHKVKTKVDVAEKSRFYVKRKKAIGIKKKSSFRGWRKMDGTTVRRKD